MAAIALLWADEAGLDLGTIRATAAAHGATTAQVTRRALASTVLAALARGGVVYLATTDEDATYALGLGVDEVLRGPRATAVSIKRAIDRARTRAEARARREHVAHRDVVGITISLLAGALGHELNNPLAVATLNAHSVRVGVGELLRIHEKLAEWAMVSMPKSEVARLSAAMAEVPSPNELRAMLADTDAALHRASTVMAILRRLSTEDATIGRVHVRPAFDDFCALFRPELEGIAELRVSVGRECEVAISRPAFVSMLTILFAYVYDCARVMPRGEKVVLELSGHDDVVLLEIRELRVSIPTDLWRHEPGAYFGASASKPDGIGWLQERAQQLGGELLAQRDGETTTLRLIMPLAEELAHDPVGVAEDVARGPRLLD